MKELFCEQCGRQIKDVTNPHTLGINGKRIYVCNKHFHQYQNYGKFLDNNPRTIQDGNTYEIVGDVAWFTTFDKHGIPSGKFQVDAEDAERIALLTWHKSHDRYVAKQNRNTVHIGWYVLGKEKPSQNIMVDHINHDPSDNRKVNLRVVNARANTVNRQPATNSTTGIPGVCWDSANKKYTVTIKAHRKIIHLGRYSYCDAVYARYVAEHILFGEYRCTSQDGLIQTLISYCNSKEEIKKEVEKRLKNVDKVA